ncbi:MAG: flagellar hook-associated protein FlgK [Deltaproteobacteria bacterium]|nr:flagellar hook-associated protein FlgK [Deltaproteobacteria bacterium]
MIGISQILNTAKEALLSHQQSVSVVGHNIANVDTPGYTRQSLALTPAIPTPDASGFFGNGVQSLKINRHYDQFMVKRMSDQNSSLSNLQAQQESMRLVETSFNEAPGLAVNELMSEFWASWQTLSSYPENISARGAAVQKAKIVIDQLNSMAAEITRTRFDINSSLNAAVADVNMLTSQIAAMNVKITASETDVRQQNDLRDQRDLLLNDLSQYLEVNYFETNTGAYSVLMGDGHTLVENDENWQIDLLDDKLQWISKNSKGDVLKTAALTESEAIGGKIGGWMEIYSNIDPDTPENYLGRLDALANALIREVNQQHSQGAGLTRFSEQLTSNDAAQNTALLTSTIDAATSTDTIQAGRLLINDREIGKIEGATARFGLANIKTYNTAQAINEAITGVRARLTTQVAGDAVAAMGAGEDGNVITLQINGIDVSYTVDSTSGPPDDTDPATLAANVVAAINQAIDDYNDPTTVPENIPKITIEAAVGDGNNGGAANSIILRNTNAGDESRIIISGIDSDPLLSETKLGLTSGTYVADADHNTGELSLFSHKDSININAGVDDLYLDQLGLGGGSRSSTDEGGDGQLIFEATDNQVLFAMQGFDYSDELRTDGGSFKIWLYNNDDTLALPQAVEVSLERAYSLQDVADSINISIINASGEATPWLNASIKDNKLVLTPDADHQFAFGGDTSNFLATAGINTFFSGSSADSIGINGVVEQNVEYIAAGQVSTIGEIFRGDQANALLITNIQSNEYVRFTGGKSDTLGGFYNTLVGDIGLKGRTVDRDYEYNTLITDQMNAMRDATSGVSLDEEMADLIKFQQAYSAAAKLITSADEMMQTLLQAV